ncbi:hypothetical protein ABPG72_016684 [Tetrahymena utriculariae]
MRFIAFALVVLIAISSVNADITNVDPYKTCYNNSKSQLASCDNAANPQTCNSQFTTFSNCMKENTNCNPDKVADVPTYVSCIKSCFNPVTDADLQKYIKSFINCLSGSFLASVAMILFALVALLL